MQMCNVWVFKVLIEIKSVIFLSSCKIKIYHKMYGYIFNYLILDFLVNILIIT